MRKELNGETLTLFPSGRIDTNNAEAVASEISDILSAEKFEQLVIDAGELEYVSSAGLRVILRLRKSYPTIRIVNVLPDVYEIFDMTGFTEMMHVERAYKRISVEGCEVIGEGANGKIYRIDEETIVKVYNNADSLESIQRERELAKKAFVLGVNTAISYDIARIGESYGTVFELLNARSLAKCVMEEAARRDHYIDMYVDLLKKIHATSVTDGSMPDMKQIALKWTETAAPYLEEGCSKKLKKLISDVPESDKMIHGDYHLKNVMVQNDEPILIDMDTLCVGNAIFEFGSIFNAYVGFSAMTPEKTGMFLGITPEVSFEVWKKTLQKYFGSSDDNVISEYEKKAKIVGYLRLLQRAVRRVVNRGEDHSAEIDFYKKTLGDLVEEVDSVAL